VFVRIIRLFTKRHFPKHAVPFQYQTVHCPSQYLAHLHCHPVATLLPQQCQINTAKWGIPARRYPHFDVVVGLAWSNDPESYVGGGVATGWAAHARQDNGDPPPKKGSPDPPAWGGGADNPIPQKYFVEKLLKLQARRNSGRRFWKRLRSTKDYNASRRRRNTKRNWELCSN
jgi:hypothetical protein